MYAACLYCNGALGANAEVEHFPVGRRLAYDAATGRLWVVCARCTGWNLTPLDERWEAIEECERLFRATRLRAATDHVGLARLAGGTELVRIGRPLRPEFAAWRYGDRFAARSRRAGRIAGAGAVAAAAGAALVALGPGFGALAPAAAVLFGPAITLPLSLATLFRQQLVLRPFTFTSDAGEAMRIDGAAATFARLTAGAGGEPALVFHVVGNLDARRGPVEERDVRVSGAGALTVAGRLLPRVNAAGAPAAWVRAAVALLDGAGSAEALWHDAARDVRRWSAEQTSGDTGSLRHLPSRLRLALEMAAHEESERRALDGELATLEAAWRDADALARVADALLVPAVVTERLDTLRRHGGRA